eukprot:scaffold28114_cov53-Attheya_sp.AAC.2
MMHGSRSVFHCIAVAMAVLGLMSQPLSTSAFAPAPLFGVATNNNRASGHFAPLFMSDSEGGAAIAKPAVKTSIKTETTTKQKSKSVQKAKVHDPITRRREEFEEAPLYKVMLLQDDDYDQEHVVDRMTDIIEDMDDNAATTVYRQAMSTGKAMCGKYPLEHAEMYSELLLRSEPMIYTQVEEENE